MNKPKTDIPTVVCGWVAGAGGWGGKFTPQKKLAILAIFLHSIQQKSYQGTLETQELTPKGSTTSLDTLLDPTGTKKYRVLQKDLVIF